METNADRFSPTGRNVRGGHAAYVNATFAELVSVFGPPNGGTDNYRVSTRWVIKDTVTGNVLDIYDYKETSTYSPKLPSVADWRARTEPHEWHVGGQVDRDQLKEFLATKLGRKVEGDDLYEPPNRTMRQVTTGTDPGVVISTADAKAARELLTAAYGSDSPIQGLSELLKRLGG